MVLPGEGWGVDTSLPLTLAYHGKILTKDFEGRLGRPGPDDVVSSYEYTLAGYNIATLKFIAKGLLR